MKMCIRDSILSVIKSLLDKEAIFVKEELRRTYKPKTETRVRPVSYTHLTMQVTIGGQSYTLLMEGSAFNGLQSIAFRKPYADNSTVANG